MGIIQQTNKNTSDIRQNTQEVQQSTQQRFIDADEELIDEIIETDPDESQHHPIVDGDANVQQYEIEPSQPENKTQEEDDRFNQNYVAFDGYDSRFFNNNKDNLTDEEQENMKLETQKNKTRATSAQRRQIMNKQSLMAQNEVEENTGNPEIEDNSNEQYITTPSQSQKFANFSVTRPLSSAKLRPSDTQKKYGRGDRLLSAHYKNNQKIKVVNSQEQHNKFTQFRQTSQQRNMMMQQQNQMMPNKIMRADSSPTEFYQTQQQFSTNQPNYMTGPPNRNLNVAGMVPPMSAQSSNASLQPPYQYIQNLQYQQQSPQFHQERQQFIQYPPQIFDQQIYAGQGYMQHQIQPFYYDQVPPMQKYNSFPSAPPIMNPYHQMSQTPLYQMEVIPRNKQGTHNSLLLQAQFPSATELPVLQPEEAKVISVLDTNVENFQKFSIQTSHIPGLNKESQLQYLGTYNTFIKSMNQEIKQASKQDIEKDKRQRRESIQLKMQRRQKRIKDKRMAKMEDDNDEQIIYRNSKALKDNNGEFGQTSTLNSDVNWNQSPQDNLVGAQGFQDAQFYSDQANGQQAQNQTQQHDEREKLRQKQKQMQLQEKQFRLSMSSMKNQISEVINEDLNESIKSNTARDPNDNSFTQPKVKMLVSQDNSNVTLSPINIEKGVEDIKEDLPVSSTPKQEVKVSSSQKKFISQESQKQDNQAKEPIEVFNLEANESVLPEAETQLIKNIFKPSEEEQIKEQEKKDDVKDQIKDLMTIKQQQSDKIFGKNQAPEKNQDPVSYEAFFKNPSGQSETQNMIEDDLLQNQNKSATVIEGEDATYDQVEDEEVKNPFQQENNDNMFNEEYQTSVTLKGQKTQDDRSNSRLRQRSKSPQQQQTEQKKGIQYTQISQQIEGITNLLQNLNNYVSGTNPEQNVDKQAIKNEMKETRFSYKMTKFSGLPELPEEPNEQAENEDQSPIMRKEKTKGSIDHKSNDAQTLKTTQQSSSHKQGGNGEQENIINIQVQNNKKSPMRSGKKSSKGQIRIKKIKRQRIRENNNQTLKKSLSLTNVQSPDRKNSAEKPFVPFKCGSYRPVQQLNSQSPDMTIPSIQRSLSPKISQAQKRSYLKSAHPSVMQNRHSQGSVTYKRINIKKMKTMHEKKKRSLGGNDAFHQYGPMQPQRLQNSMSSMGFSSSNMMSQTLRPSNMNMGQQQFLSTQAPMRSNNYLPKNDSRQRANRATTATRQQLFDIGQYPSLTEGNRVFSAQNHGTGGDHPQDYIQVHRSSQEALYRNQLMYQQQKYGSTVRPPYYNQDNTSLTATNKQMQREQYGSQASGEIKMQRQKYSTIQADIDNRGRIYNNSSSPYRGQPISNYIQYGPNMTSHQMMQIQHQQQIQQHNSDLRGQDLVRYDLPDSQLKSPYNHKIRLAPKGKRPISNQKNSDFYQTQRYGMHEQRPPLGINQIQQMNDTRTQRMNVNSQQFHGSLHDPRFTQYNKDMPPPHAIGGGILRPQSSAPNLGNGKVFTSNPDSIPGSHHYLNQNQQIKPFTQHQSQTNQQNDNRIQSAHDGTQPLINNDYQTRQYMPPLPQESKQQRIASGNSKKQQKLETGLSSVRGTNKKRATSSRGSRLASAQMRNSKGLRNTMRSGSGKGSKGSKGSQIEIINSQRQKTKKQSNGNNQSNNGQQNMQQPVVIQQIFGLGYQPGMVQSNPQSVSQP